MKSIQNGFTTMEQSQRLVDIGVPLYSVDCYYSGVGWGRNNDTLQLMPDDEHRQVILDYFRTSSLYTPAWSAGRLIEIIKTCRVRKSRSWDLFYSDKPLIEQLITIIGTCDMDFSKLKDYE